MLTLNFSAGCSNRLHVDRDGVASANDGQGLDIAMSEGVNVHFDDENDAGKIAIAIVRRLGLEGQVNGNA